MWKRVLLLVLVSCVCCSVALAQPPGLPTIPEATVGVPYNVNLFELFGITQELAVIAQDGISFSIITTVGAGTFPPGLSLSSDGVISGTPTTPGDYNFTMNFAFSVSYMGQNFSETAPIPFVIDVGGNAGPPIAIDPGGVSFSITEGDTNAVSKTILISNISETPQTFTATASSSSSSSWLSVAPGSGAAPFGTTSLTISVNPGGLTAGAYAGTVALSFTPSGQTFSVPVLATVNSSAATMELSQSGFYFRTASGGGTPPVQTLSILNAGSGTFPFNAAATTISGGSWLSVSPTSGTASSARSPLAINVNPAGLAAGDYYGQIQTTGTGVSNSPQIATVVLSVAAAGTDLGALVQPTGLIFVAQAGGTNPAPQTVSLTTPDSTALAFNTLVPASNLFTVSPASGSISAGSPVQVQVQPSIAGLAAGVYTGSLTLDFTTDNTLAQVAVVVIVTPGASGAAERPAVTLMPRASTCTPTQLVPVFTLLGSGFATVAAWPTPLAVTVVDDCGNFLTSGSVVASFSTGDPAISLLSLGNGSWTGTWQPQASATQATITVQAQELAPKLSGTSSIGGTLQANPTTPVISAGGAVSAASVTLNQPLAPGSFVSVFGANLSAGQNLAQALPLATQLGATQVILAGEQLPLSYAANGQVNAIVPYDVPINATTQLVVMNGPAISMPQAVVIAPVQPAVFTQDGSGQGAGIVVAATASGSQFLIDANDPITAGDVAIIYCSGLGAVDPPVPAGNAVPLSPLSHTTNTVTVTIGGVNAPVQFAGLAPAFASGLYQVNALIPSGITPGPSVPLVVTVGGTQSTPVTINLQ